MGSKYGDALEALYRKIRENNGIKFSKLSKSEQKMVNTLERQGRVETTPIPGHDWIVN